MMIQCVSSARFWVANVVDHTDASARIAPTDRSKPPPVTTKVMPMLTTPMVAAKRRMVSMLSTLANRSPAVMTPAAQISSSARTRPMLRPKEPLISPPPLSRSVSAAACSTRTVSVEGATVFSTAPTSGPLSAPGLVLCSLMRPFLP